MTQSLIKIFLAVLVGVAVLVGGTFIFQRLVLYRIGYRTPIKSTTSMSQPLLAGGIYFEISTTTSAQEKGLSGRATIPSNYGMLFVFHNAKHYGFWMKDMLTPIDIIWLSDNGTIIGIENSVQPDTYPSVLYPPRPVKYVLEMRADSAQKRKWKVGTIVLLPLPYREDISH